MQSYTQSIRSKITYTGDVVDVHARWRTALMGGIEIAFCGVYVHPTDPVPGYWFFPETNEARELLLTVGVLPYPLPTHWPVQS